MINGLAGLHRRSYLIGESQGTIISDGEEAVQRAVEVIKHQREELGLYIREFKEFQLALDPLEAPEGSRVAKLMAEHSKAAGVGPMAAVAGVLADLAVEEMLEAGASVAVVENGGEAAFTSDRPVNIALQAGDAPLSKRIGFRLEEFPVGVATSSGLFSHALSFGKAEAVTIFAESAGLADAAATAVGNVVKGENEQYAARRGVDTGLSIEGVRGVFVLYRGAVGMGGRLPPIIGVDPDDPGELSIEMGGR